jgi:hypothetical protein
MYLHQWKNGERAQMLRDFNIPEQALAGAYILLASYSHLNTMTEVFVFFQRDNKFWEVHVSRPPLFYNIEGCWEAESSCPFEVIVTDLKAVHQAQRSGWAFEAIYDLDDLLSSRRT